MPYDDQEYRKTYQGMNRRTEPAVIAWGEPVAAADVGKALREYNDAFNLRQMSEELRQRLIETGRMGDPAWMSILTSVHVNLPAKTKGF